MPELPEVETIRRDLARDAKGKKIKGVEIRDPRVVKQPAPAQFKRRLMGTRLEAFYRRAKVLVIKLSTADYLVVHLRMTGQLVYSHRRDKKARVIFNLTNGRYLNFNDQRLFGELRVVGDWQKIKFVRSLGIEPLERGFSAKKFAEMLKGRKAKIKPLLMDQTFIAGIGNLYAQEALFLAGIMPDRAANTIQGNEIKQLHQAIQGVLRAGIRYRGSSVDNYVTGRGETGQYHKRLKVYDRKGEKCIRCNAKIVKVALGGRGTCFCPKCQG